jgi:8-oxo-dGTP diphosphatase
VPAPVTPFLAVDAIVPRRGRVLLIRRGRPPFEGSWALPGGFVEVGESVEAAVVRELEEETGLRGKVTRLVGVYSDPGRDPRGHTVSVVFELSAPSGLPRGADDAREAAFHGPRLPPLAFDHARILTDWMGRRTKRR